MKQTLQQNQIEELINQHELLEIHICESALGYGIDYVFHDEDELKQFIVYLFTQKNKLRIFKTLDAAFKHVKHLGFTNGECNKLSKNIHIHPTSL